MERVHAEEASSHGVDAACVERALLHGVDDVRIVSDGFAFINVLPSSASVSRTDRCGVGDVLWWGRCLSIAFCCLGLMSVWCAR